MGCVHTSFSFVEEAYSDTWYNLHESWGRYAWYMVQLAWILRTLCLIHGTTCMNFEDVMPETWYNLHESWGRYAKWNKPVTKGQILEDSISWGG
jgi:hypothetical protein